VTNFQRIDKKQKMLQSEQNVVYFHVSAAMMIMIFKIKFEPTEEFNFEKGYKIIKFSYVNSISAQRRCGINVEECCFILFLPNGDIK
jgi:hypothetical protein